MQLSLRRTANGFAIRAGGAQLGRLALQRLGFGGGVAGDDPPNPRYIEFPEAIHLGFGVHAGAGGADRVGEVWVTFFNHQTAIDPLGKLADQLIGSGYVTASLSTLAAGLASRACRKVTPEAIIPRRARPRSHG